MSVNSRLSDINDRVLTVPWKQKVCSISQADEMIRKIRTWVVEENSDILTDITAAKTSDFLVQWSKFFSNTSTWRTRQWLFFKSEGIWAVKLPFQEDLNIHDNFHMLTLFLWTYYNAGCKYFLDRKHQTNLALEHISTNVPPAMWVGLKYHNFVFQTLTEDFSINIQDLDQETYDKRLESWYQTIAKISSHLEMLTMRFLDTIATAEKINPFRLNNEIDSIELKSEVLDILDVATWLFHSMKTWNDDINDLRQRLSILMRNYTWNDNAYIRMMTMIESDLKIDVRKHHWCHAHLAKVWGISLFKFIFNSSMQTFQTYYNTFKDKELKKNTIPCISPLEFINLLNNDSKMQLVAANSLWVLSMGKALSEKSS